MVDPRPLISDDLRFRVLHLLQSDPGMSERELAHGLGISHGKAHYCLKALLDKGLVKLQNFANSRHRLGYAYLLTPEGAATKAALAQAFLRRKMAEYEALKAEIDALQHEVERGRAQAHEGGECR